MTERGAILQVRAALADKRNWTQGVLARDRDGQRVYCLSHEATCWCVDGMTYKVEADHGVYIHGYITAASYELHAAPPAVVNDDLGHDAVLAVLEHAAKLTP